MKAITWFISFFLALAMLGQGRPVLADEEPSESKKSRQGEYLTLTVGLTQDKTIPYVPKEIKLVGDFKPLTKVSLAAETKTLRFTPIKEGSGTLTVLDERGRKIYEFYITVRKSNLHTIAREIKSLLGDIEGIDIKIINNKVVVDGQILLPRDMNRIYSVVTQYGESASSIVTLSPVAQKKIAEFIERDVNNPEIHARAVNDRFILEGVAADEAERQRAEIIAKTYVPDAVVEAAEGTAIKKRKVEQVVINLITLKPAAAPEPGKIIQLIVHYVELQKDYTKGFRFQWTPDLADGSGLQFTTGGGGTGVVSQITGTINNLLPKLNWAKEHGHARVLQSTSLIVQDGQPGTIRSETRIPYQKAVQGSNATTTDFEDVGIVSAITPKIMGPRSDSINLKMDFSLKALLGMSGGGPLVSSNKINTVITVRSGQSAAVGGLVSNSSGTDYNKLPKGTSENPIISLYASKTFRRNQSQFVVFITPVIKSSASSGAEQIKQKFKLNE